MDITKNNFIVFLVCEMHRKTQTTYEDAFKEVKSFTDTIEFELSFNKWKNREFEKLKIQKEWNQNAYSR